MTSKGVRVHRRHSNATVDPSIAAKMQVEGKGLRATSFRETPDLMLDGVTQKTDASASKNSPEL